MFSEISEISCFSSLILFFDFQIFILEMAIEQLLSLCCVLLLSLVRQAAATTQTVCVNHTDAFGFVKNTAEHRYIEKGWLEGDIDRIANAPVWQVAFYRPKQVLVCADENYVHGLQLTIKEHEADDLAEA